MSLKSLQKISVIIPSFNQDKYIEQTIESILSQKYVNVEIIVLDGGSTDNTTAILKKYSSKIYWESKKDKGQSDAINKGLKRATGDILMYLNSDDILLPGSLQVVSEFFSNNPKNMWVTGKCINISEKGTPIRLFVTFWKNSLLTVSMLSPTIASWLLFIANYISQPATFFRKEVFKSIGEFNSSLHLTMDYDYWLRLSKVTDLKIMGENLAAFRIHSEAKSQKNYKNVLDEGYRVLQKFTTNKVFLLLHRLHDILSLTFYKRSNLS